MKLLQTQGVPNVLCKLDSVQLLIHKFRETLHLGFYSLALITSLNRKILVKYRLLCSAALTIAVPSVRMEKPRRVHWAVAQLLVGSRSLTTYPNICRVYCTDFHSHNASLTGSRPWCGGACLAGRSPISASSAALSLLVQAVVHCVLCPR